MVAQLVKNLPAMWETWVRSLSWEDPLEKEMATPSRILAWKIPWVEEPGVLQSMGLQRVGHNWATSLYTWFYPVHADSFSPDISQLHVELKGWVMITNSQCPDSRYCQTSTLTRWDTRSFLQIFSLFMKYSTHIKDYIFNICKEWRS